jgi:phenylpropionate dioxygenase-like ring-hydroxylating dioxygenase large terminal subunit
MIDFDPLDYRNFIHGVVSKSFLARKKWFSFTLWDEELIFFWNNGDIRCYKNSCRHYGLPLSQGKLTNGHVICGLHGWKYELSEGNLIHSPYAKKTPKCKLKGYKAFIKNGIVFVYAGDEEYFEKAKQFVISDITENQASFGVVYEVPFYLALNAAVDYPHFAFHKYFYPIYSIFRWTFFKKNTMMTTYTPVILEETDVYYKYKVLECNVEVTVYPFCVKIYDLVSKNEWQIFILPISKTKSRYLHTIKSHSKNKLFNMLSYLFFYTVNRYSAQPEDQKWLKAIYKNHKKDNYILCDHDFSLKNYLKKFIIKPKSIK